MNIAPANTEDLEQILLVQKEAFQKEAERYLEFKIQPLCETKDEIRKDMEIKTILKAEINHQVVGSIRAKQNEHDFSCELSRLSVLPQYQGKGIATQLLLEIEKYFPNAVKFVLATGVKSDDNIQLYKKIGYQFSHYDTFNDGVDAIYMAKSGN